MRRCNMKIVVIGGTGISGKKLIPLLRERGHEVAMVNVLTRMALPMLFS
jgi:nucleoside-diphosphate-sugar epimerase